MKIFLSFILLISVFTSSICQTDNRDELKHELRILESQLESELNFKIGRFYSWELDCELVMKLKKEKRLLYSNSDGIDYKKYEKGSEFKIIKCDHFRVESLDQSGNKVSFNSFDLGDLKTENKKCLKIVKKRIKTLSKIKLSEVSGDSKYDDVREIIDKTDSLKREIWKLNHRMNCDPKVEIDEFEDIVRKEISGPLEFTDKIYNRDFKFRQVDNIFLLHIDLLKKAEYTKTPSIFSSLGCINSKSTMHLIFTNGDKLKLNHYGKLNCDGELIIDITDHVEKFRLSEIRKIRFSLSDKYLDLEILDSTEAILANKLNCLLSK